MIWASLRKYWRFYTLFQLLRKRGRTDWMQMALRQFGLCDMIHDSHDWPFILGWISATMCAMQKKEVQRLEQHVYVLHSFCCVDGTSGSERTKEMANFWNFSEETFQEPKPQATQAVAALDTPPFFCGNARILHVLKCSELRVQVVPLRVHHGLSDWCRDQLHSHVQTGFLGQ